MQRKNVNQSFLSHVELLDETVEYYKTNPRSFKHGSGCLYIGENDERCAVGRCLNKQALEEIRESMDEDSSRNLNDTDSETLFEKLEDFLVELFDSKYRKIHNHFWAELQLFHDANTHWEENNQVGSNLTELGKKRYIELQKKAKHYDKLESS